jgi:predicted ATPase
LPELARSAIVRRVTSEIVGRDEELAALHAFLGRGDDGPRALVLEGEAGIGKSTLWLAAVDAARERGYRVLVSRPSEAEQGLAFVGLGDLFDGVVDEVLPALAAPRRRALEQALRSVRPRSARIRMRSASPSGTPSSS